MVQNCCVPGCRSRSQKGAKITFSKFPKDPEMLEKWLSAINRKGNDGAPWTPTQNDRVCYLHFRSPDDFLPGLLHRFLLSEAVPSIFPPAAPAQKQPKPRKPRPSRKRRKAQAAEPNTPQMKKICNKDHAYSTGFTSSRMVYLDYNATTPLSPEVVETITQTLTDAWGNPSSKHKAGLKAKDAIDRARKDVATMIGAESSDIIFTSGGTEANNWILKMGLDHFHESNNLNNHQQILPHFITTNVEHDSVRLVLEKFKELKLADVTFVPVCSNGAVSVKDVVSAVRLNTVMVSIMLANNETGVIQPIEEICEAIRSLTPHSRSLRKILLHTDAAQAIGKIPVDVAKLGVDFLTVVGHKFYGPRIGAIYARNPGCDTRIYPMLFGGGQERNFRPGTENTPMIAGLGKAAELVVMNLDEYREHMKRIRDYLENKLKDVFGDDVVFNGKSEDCERLPNTCNVSFVGGKLKGWEILSQTTSLQASVGAACHSQDKPSHILLAMGISPDVASKAVRISVGRETTKEDIDEILLELKHMFDR